MLTMRVMEKNYIIYGTDSFLGPHLSFPLISHDGKKLRANSALL